MKIAGEAQLQAPVERVWEAILDPAVLVRTIPGCERLETTGEHTYAMTVTVGVAAVRGTYTGACALSDLRPHESLVLTASGAGSPGTIEAEVAVTLSGNGDGTTTVRYDADAVAGGMIGGVGQRMLTSVSKRLAGEFFSGINAVLTGAEPAPAAADGPPAGGASAPSGTTFSAPARAGSATSERDFLRGVLVGGGLVLAGVLAGALAARRRS